MASFDNLDDENKHAVLSVYLMPSYTRLLTQNSKVFRSIPHIYHYSSLEDVLEYSLAYNSTHTAISLTINPPKDVLYYPLT